MISHAHLDPAAWHPQSRLAASIASSRQLQVFNDRGGIAVNFDVMRSTTPNIEIIGSQSETISFWETRSSSGFVTNPKFNADLLTIRFVTNGNIVYRHRTSNAVGSPTHATLVGFDDLREVQASSAFNAISGTIAIKVLAAANDALTGDKHSVLPQLAHVAEVATPGMQALFCTLRYLHLRSMEIYRHSDLISPLAQEVISYQLLSSWPRVTNIVPSDTKDFPSRCFQDAIDYIESNLSHSLTLSEIAAIAGVSVRSLQNRFRQKIGQTPVQFIIDQRLRRAHGDLIASCNASQSIAVIAKRWGFVHMGDFGRRYRQLYGCAPSEMRRDNTSNH